MAPLLDICELTRAYKEIQQLRQEKEIQLLRQEIQQLRVALGRCHTILANMAQQDERRGLFGTRRWWAISDEPLRRDAENLLPLLDEVLDKEV